MKAEILGDDIPFTVADEVEPPRSITITMRPCWRKPAIKYELAYAYEEGNVVYYHVVSKS